MDADTGKKEMARIEGNVAIEPGSSNEGEIGVSQQGTPSMMGDAPVESDTSSQQEANFGERGTPRMGGALPVLNPMATFFIPHTQAATIAGPTTSASDTLTVRPASHRPSTPPSFERFARELRELKSTGLSNKQRLAVMHDQRRQLLGHITTAKAEIDQLEGRLQREESIEGSQDILNRLKELNGLHGWVGYKWAGLEEEMADLEAEVATPGSREDEFWGL
ncbi:MAG: hypothetical protein ALECFALPRED_007676 [Alectoria fallacina]|uniref:Uncharacterized protein n=1 Tax=Alectoria fallacina TaxID=1903189 RepID=A0A8H3J0F0_9LECA|nr:MAG: hypothetical protein ALECFALPRED_007676 [Alectoria fallacina]